MNATPRLPVRRAAIRRLAIGSALGIVLAALCSCPASDRRERAGTGGAAVLMRNLIRAGRVDVEVEEHALEEPFERAAAEARGAADASKDLEWFVRGKGAAKDASSARIVVGTAASKSARRLAEQLGVKTRIAGDRAAFGFGDQDFPERDDALIATFEDPERAGLPLTLLYGNDAERLGRRARELGAGWKPWMWIYRGGALVLSGPLSPAGRPSNADLRRVGLERLVAESAMEPIARPPAGFEGRASRELSAADVDVYCARCVAARRHVLAWASPEASTGAAAAPVTRIVLHARVESFALAGGKQRLAVCDPVSREVAAWILGALSDNGASVAESVACELLGEPSEPWMSEAAGIDAAWSWFARPLDRWLERLVTTQRVLPIARLVDSRAGEDESAHVLGPERGAFWRFLRETRGDRFVREVWRDTRALQPTPELDATFRAWLDARVRPFASEVEGRRGMRRELASKQPFFKGVGIAELPLGARSGYASQLFLQSLDAARENGADAVALTSFCVDDPGLPPLASRAANTCALGSREGDAILFIALAQARTRGLRTMLQPNLLSGPAGTWSGTWTRKDEAEWRRFFDRYARFVEHYALLGELAGCDLLSLGRGLASVTSERPEGRRAVAAEVEWKRAGWQRVVSVARSGFAGLVTYAAGSLDEADKVVFWNDVDAVGVELFPALDLEPPSGAGTARDAIAAGTARDLAHLVAIAERTGKPLMVTQAGFDPSVLGAATVLGRGSASAEWQAQEIAIVGECLRDARVRAKLWGVFAWRWSSDASDVGSSAHDGVIAHPTAKAALRGFFGGL